MTEPRQDEQDESRQGPPAPHRVLRVPGRDRSPRWPYTKWCPRCKGAGQVPAPWSLLRTTKLCPSCGGERVVLTLTIVLWRGWQKRRHPGA